MALKSGQLVFDPMAGSGTTGASAVKNGFKAILCDKSEEYVSMMEQRLNVKRISISSWFYQSKSKKLRTMYVVVPVKGKDKGPYRFKYKTKM